MTSISICIPVYNVSPYYLAETIDSAIEQRPHVPCEIILSDDCSSIDYSTVLSQYPKEIIKYSRNATNLGMAGNWNAAVKKCNGDLVLLLGQDDLISPVMLSSYINEFETDPDVVLVSSARSFIDDKGNIFPRREFHNDRSKLFVTARRYVLAPRLATKFSLLYGNIIGEPSCVMFRKSIFELIGGYNEGFRHAADLDYNLRVIRHGKMVYVNEPFLRRRLHADNLTNSNLRSGQVTEERAKLFEEHSRQYGFSPEEIAEFKCSIVMSSIRHAAKGLATLNHRLTRFSINSIFRYFEMRPKIYFSRMLDIIVGANRDRM